MRSAGGLNADGQLMPVRPISIRIGEDVKFGKQLFFIQNSVFFLTPLRPQEGINA